MVVCDMCCRDLNRELVRYLFQIYFNEKSNEIQWKLIQYNEIMRLEKYLTCIKNMENEKPYARCENRYF